MCKELEVIHTGGVVLFKRKNIMSSHQKIDAQPGGVLLTKYTSVKKIIPYSAFQRPLSSRTPLLFRSPTGCENRFEIAGLRNNRDFKLTEFKIARFDCILHAGIKEHKSLEKQNA